MGGAHRARYSCMGTYVFVSGSRTHPLPCALIASPSASSPAHSLDPPPIIVVVVAPGLPPSPTPPSPTLTRAFATSRIVPVSVRVRHHRPRHRVYVRSAWRACTLARSACNCTFNASTSRANAASSWKSSIAVCGESPSGWRRRARDARRNTPRGVFSPPLRLFANLRERPSRKSRRLFFERGRGGAGAGASAAGSRAHATGADAAMGARDASAAADVSIRDATSASSDASTPSRHRRGRDRVRRAIAAEIGYDAAFAFGPSPVLLRRLEDAREDELSRPRRRRFDDAFGAFWPRRAHNAEHARPAASHATDSSETHVIIARSISARHVMRLSAGQSASARARWSTNRARVRQLDARRPASAA